MLYDLCPIILHLFSIVMINKMDLYWYLMFMHWSTLLLSIFMSYITTFAIWEYYKMLVQRTKLLQTCVEISKYMVFIHYNPLWNISYNEWLALISNIRNNHWIIDHWGGSLTNARYPTFDVNGNQGTRYILLAMNGFVEVKCVEIY